MISQETTDLLISINFSYIKKIFNYNVQSVIKTIDINEFTCQNENLLVILISTLQCLFISKDIDIENKNNLVLQSIGIFEKLIEQLNTYREKYLRIISLFYYEILYYINLLPNENITTDIKNFIRLFKEFTVKKIKDNINFKGNYFIDKLLELVEVLDKNKKMFEKEVKENINI